VRALRKAKEYGQFLIAGIHTDATIEAVTGCAPVMTLHERVLSVLALRVCLALPFHAGVFLLILVYLVVCGRSCDWRAVRRDA
jgi:glycerol-3-phosphate cytidylyltransferase-like family protein